MKKRYIIIGISLLVVINIAALTTFSYHKYCQYNETCLSEETNEPRDYLCRHLSLSDAQTETMHSLRMNFQHRMAAINSSLQEKRSRLIDLLSSNEPNKFRIESVIDEINGIQSKLQKDAVDNILKEMKILTPAQKAEYILLIHKRLINHNNPDGMGEQFPFQDSLWNKLPDAE